MQFSELMQGLKLDAGVWSVSVPEDWAQGRSVFGGLQSALALHAMRALVPKDLPLRTLQTTFIAPVPAGLVRARAQVLRAGKSAIHVQAQLFDGENILCIVVGVFGASRPSAVTIIPRQPVVEAPRPLDFPFVPGITPSFTRHFSMRWLRGGLPYTNSALSQAVIELGMHDAGTATEAHVLAIADVIPPLALSMLKKPAPGSSMTWMIEFLGDRLEGLSLQGWRVDADLTAGRDGYTSQSVMLWGPGGEAVALSRQNMVVFG